jgi:hypothetical protein
MSKLQPLDPERIGKDLLAIRTAIHSRIIGQNDAIDSVIDALAVQDARLSNPKRPRLVGLATASKDNLKPTRGGNTSIEPVAKAVPFGRDKNSNQ